MNELIIIILLVACAVGLFFGIKFLNKFELKYTYISKSFPNTRYRIEERVSIYNDKEEQWYKGILFVNLDTGEEFVMKEDIFFDLFMTIDQSNTNEPNTNK